MKTSILLAACVAGLALAGCANNEFGRGKVVAYLEAQGHTVLAVSAQEAGVNDEVAFCNGTWKYYPFLTEQGRGIACIDSETGAVSLGTLRDAPSLSTDNPPPTED